MKAAVQLDKHMKFDLRAVCVEHHDLVVYQTAKKREDWYCRQWHYPEQTKCRILNLWMEVPG